jgi:hypothetical protein
MRIVGATNVSKDQASNVTKNGPSSLSNKCPPTVTVKKENTSKHCTECNVEKSCDGFSKKTVERFDAAHPCLPRSSADVKLYSERTRKNNVFLILH